MYAICFSYSALHPEELNGDYLFHKIIYLEIAEITYINPL